MDPQQTLARLKTLSSAFSRAQLVSIVGAFALVVAIVGSSAWWVKSPSYTLLFSDMDADTAGQVITKLKTMKVSYELDEGGRGIRVPSDRVDELRIQLTSEGLPQSGRIGFEIFDKTQFGATEFLEQVNYRRALEGEIARTIATMGNVASARVHIAMGKDSLFGDPRPAKASVVLKLRGQRGLSDSSVNGIGNLIAASVEGLRPEAVVILDSFGRPLARPQDDPADPMGAAQGERQQRLEKAMAEKVVALLEPVVGAEHVRVNVSMKLNPASREETEELYDPNAVIRSRQSSADQAAGAAAAAGAVAGSRGNMPVDPKTQNPDKPAPAGSVAATSQSASAAPSNGPSRSSETTNYEISRKTRHIIEPPGEVARLSVAVIIDDDQVVKTSNKGEKTVAHKPRTREELQKMQGLVAAAVGLESTRGDTLTVENIAFDEPIVDEAPPATMLQKIITPEVKEGSRMLIVLGLAVFALLFVVRPLLSRAMGPIAAAAPRPVAAMAAATAGAPVQLPKGAEPGKPLRTVADVESEIEAQLDANITDKDRRLPVLTKRVTSMSMNEPEQIAKLLRTWMNENER